nr:hypothetical protein Iba_chr12aCG12710 [Ipomoea batatas]GMD60593.1 hypothetical protein Iba_chr12aCG12720 [Ipomoea batatas]
MLNQQQQPTENPRQLSPVSSVNGRDGSNHLLGILPCTQQRPSLRTSSRSSRQQWQRDAMKLRPQCLLSTSAVACAAEDVRAEILRRQQWRPSLLDEAVWFGGNGVVAELLGGFLSSA